MGLSSLSYKGGGRKRGGVLCNLIVRNAKGQKGPKKGVSKSRSAEGNEGEKGRSLGRFEADHQVLRC